MSSNRLERRRRVRCRLPCEIVAGRRKIEATVVSLSEGGLGLEAKVGADQGDPIRIVIMPHRRKRAVTVDALVWNEREARGAWRSRGLRLLGCVISDPSQAFLDLMGRPEPRSAARERSSRAVPPTCVVPPPAATEPATDLPRSRDPLPPPKPEPEEALPTFRVRFKQVGGPRTRIFAVRARSAAEAAKRARAELPSTTDWELLEANHRD